MTSGGGVGGQVDVLFVEVQARADEQSLRQMEAAVGQAGERAGQGAGGKMSAAFTGLVAGATATIGGLVAGAAASVGAALAAGLSAPLQIAQQVNQGILDLQASLGVTAEEAKGLGEVAKRVFGNNWGGDLAEAQKAVANVRKEIQGLSDTDLQTVTEGSLAIADRFEEDQSKVAAAVQSLMKATGQSAQESLDFIAAGFQKGLNSSGDFLDTLQEYSPQFEKAKITGDALFSLLETGAAKGALGTDKVADAFKEFGLTIVDVNDGSKAVYAELGLSQEKLAKQVNDGTITQAQAFQLVTDKLKGVQGVADRTRIAAAIFGGAGEDFGPGLTQLDLTKTKLSDIKGSTDTVKNATNTLQGTFQTAFRQVQLALEPAGQELLKLANDAMPAVSAGLAKLGPIVTQVVRFLVDGFRQGRETAEQFAPVFNQALSAIQPVVLSLGSLFVTTFNLVKTLWETVLRPTFIAILPIVSTVFGGIASAVTTAITTVTNIVNAVSALLRGDWSQAWNFLAGAVVGALAGVEKYLTDFLPKLVTAGGNLATSLINGMQKGLDGLQAMILSALAKALGTLGDNLPPILKPLAEKLAKAAQDAADANVAPSVTLKKLGPAGPSLSDIINPTPSAGKISGQDLVAALGLGGNRTGTPFGGTYFGGQIHNGEDYFGPVGTKLMAPFTGLLTTRWSETTGRILELVDQTGQKLLLGHLEGFKGSLKGLPEDIQAAFKAAKGGPILVQKDQEIGSIGQTGTLAHADIAGNAHLHLMAYDKDGNIFDPKTAKFVPIEDTEEARAILAKQKGTNPVPTGVGGAAGAGAGVNITVPLPTAAEQEKYNFKLADYLKYQKDVLALAAELRKAEEAHNTELAQRIKERIALYIGENDAKRGAIEFAKSVLADRAALEADAGKKEEETTQQKEQRILREQAAQRKLTADIRAAGEDRLKTIIKTGITTENNLAKINAAEAELDRRGQLTQADTARANAARRQAQKEAEDKARADKEKADADADARAKEGAANRLAADRAMASGQIGLASTKAQAVIDAYNRESNAAGLSADQKVAIEERLGANVLKARNVQAQAAAQLEVNRLKTERNAAVNAEGLTLTQRQGLWAQYADKIKQINSGLDTTLKNNAEDSTQQLVTLRATAAAKVTEGETAQAQATLNEYVGVYEDLAAYRRELAADQAKAAAEQTAAEVAQADATRAEYITLYEDLAAFRREYLAEQARLDAADMARMNAFYTAQSEATAAAIAEIEQGARDSEEEALKRASNPTSTLMGYLAELKAQDLDPRTSGFTQVLQDWVDLGGPAGKAAQIFKDNLNSILVLMGFVREEVDMGLEGIKPNPARTPGGFAPLVYEDTPVDAIGARPKLTPEQQAAAAKASLPVDPQVPKDLGDAWAAMQKKLQDSAFLTETAARMKGLNDEQLAAAKSTAELAKNVPEYTAALAEEARRTVISADSTKLMKDAQAELTGMLFKSVPAYEARALKLEEQADLDTKNAAALRELAKQLREVGKAVDDNAAKLNVTVKIGGIDTGIKQLDLYKSALQGVADIISKTFENLVDGSEVSAQSVVKSMASMALGIVKQVAVAIIAYEAQAIALAIISGATFNFVQAGLAIAAAAAVAGIAAGLQSRLGASQAVSSSGSVSTSSPSSTPTSSTNNSVTIPTSQVTVMATPEFVGVFGGHVDRFGGYINTLVTEGVLIRTGPSTSSKATGLTAFDLSTP
ncbi:phage tail tape measure protein [Deinococcus oregonensis]|uniref:Phage tail tape measure protein n=1 Tax=Deinococcus oregonensis TaxID=1805970 RepID=A0ABV6B4A6_9DEIO